ncbi:hypothetical protein [Flagellimonas sp.]|uniref:hypothetical protein n=1 Tax=Flagellimonas sp. TaxID=2058762 RepID=UPI003F4A12F7
MRNLMLLFGFFCTQMALAQFGKNCEVRQIKINMFHPGLEYEMSLGVNSTLDARVAYQFSLDPFKERPIENYKLFPAITIQNRYYYNFDKRATGGRQIYGNSANYIAPSASVFFAGDDFVGDDIPRSTFATAGLVTGIQRSYNSGLSFSVDVGAAYYLGEFNGGIHPVFNLSIGWIVSEKRWCVGR